MKEIKHLLTAAYYGYARRFRLIDSNKRRTTGAMSDILKKLNRRTKAERGTGKIICLADDGTELGWFEFKEGTLVERGPTRWAARLIIDPEERKAANAARTKK